MIEIAFQHIGIRGPNPVRRPTRPDAQVIWYAGPGYQTHGQDPTTTTNAMSTKQIPKSKAVPRDLDGCIHLNQEHQVLVCRGCRTAVCPGALVEHLARFHGLGAGRVRNRVKEYIKDFKHIYDHATIPTPADWTAPQRELQSIWGWLCTRCGFRSKSKKRARRHANEEHGLKWGGVDKIIIRVRLQTWFTQRQKYWVIIGDEKEKDIAAEAGGRSSQNTPGKGGSEDIEVGRVTSDNGNPEGTGEAVIRRRKRTDDSAVAGRPAKQVRFARQVEVGGLDGLEQQLERWSKECVVCYLVGGDEAGSGHTVWACRQAVAEGVRMDSRDMEDGMRRGPVGGSCPGCSVPRALCERWQWGARWEDSTGQCQYEGVLISTMVAMAALGRGEGRRRVGKWLRGDGVDPQGREDKVYQWFGERVGWEGIEAGRLALVFMMLAGINGALRVL
jgi:Orsellinic acid/F9775 biosynthesis cluster protein D